MSTSIILVDRNFTASYVDKRVLELCFLSSCGRLGGGGIERNSRSQEKMNQTQGLIQG